MKKYGPLVNIWEGSNQGEGYLRYAKPKVSNIHHKNWQVNAHVSLLNENAMNTVIDCHIDNRVKIDEEDKKLVGTKKNKFPYKKLFHKYKSINEVLSLYQRN